MSVERKMSKRASLPELSFHVRRICEEEMPVATRLLGAVMLVTRLVRPGVTRAIDKPVELVSFP